MRWLTGAVCVTSLFLAVAPLRAVSADPLSPVMGAADLAARVVELTNAERQKSGLTALVPNDTLAQAAGEYSTVLATSGCFAHTCGPVPDFSARVANAGYSGYTALAENIAGGQRTPEAVVSAWMASPGHRANILNPAYNEIGVGSATGGQYGIYWTQEFGARKGVVAPAQPAVPAPPASPDAPADAAAVPVTPASADSAVSASAGDAADAALESPVDGASADVAPDSADAPAEAASAAQLAAPAAPGALTPADLELTVLDLVNQARADNGLAPLALDPLMSDVAREHSADMQANGMSHTGSDGSTPRDRLLRAGVRLAWNGENIWSYHNRRAPEQGPQTMHDAMMAEPLEPGNWNHIANILMPNFKRIGIGVVVGPDGIQYLTEDFAD